jgi:hypothetical protein
MTNAEIKAQMDKIESKLDDALITLHKKIDPLTIEMAKMQGAIGAIKWLGGVGFAAILIIIALLELKYK